MQSIVLMLDVPFIGCYQTVKAVYGWLKTERNNGWVFTEAVAYNKQEGWVTMKM